jgi:hypothetical protein
MTVKTCPLTLGKGNWGWPVIISRGAPKPVLGPTRVKSPPI